MSGIKLKFIFYLSLGLFCILIPGVYFSISYIQGKFISYEDQQFAKLGTFFEFSLGDAIGKSDQELIKLSLDALMQTYHPRKISLYSSEGKILYFKQLDDESDPKQASKDILSVTKDDFSLQMFSMDIRRKGERIATIEIYYDYRDAIITSGHFEALQFLFAIIIFASVLGLTYVILNRTTDEVSAELMGLSDKSKELNQIALEVDDSSKHISKFASKLIQDVLESSLTLQKISKMTSLNNDVTREAQKRYMEVYNLCENGKRAISNLIETIKDVQKSTHSFEKLKNHIKEISSKTHILNEIAVQTKILSYNASIEAMRVGLHGKGFAIVAQEIRQLAIFVESYAREINNIVEYSDAVAKELIDDSLQKVAQGIQNTMGVSTVFNNINLNIVELRDISDKVVGASQKQKDLIKTVNRTISDLEHQNRMNARIAESNENASSRLATHASSIRYTIDGIHLIISGAEGLELPPSKRSVGPALGHSM
ncbi:MAG: methyl-accepting chemotaxis protein [Oligoflexia bacterium]|nr:methyl-accepting chemotaxis protein [Oligoflexia bacterium]MBF0364413.1 methyl-accepting chemotaxis protein [Oligoflexia bacterium]